MRRLFPWLFVLGLTAVPPLVGWQTYSHSPHLPPEIIPLWQQFMPVTFITTGLSISAISLLRLPAYLQNWPQEVKLLLLALLTFFTLLILWIAILLANYSLSVPTVGTAVAPTWVLLIGSLATLLLLLSVLYWADQLYLQSERLLAGRK